MIIVKRLKSIPQYIEIDSYKCRREERLEMLSIIAGTVILSVITGGLILLTGMVM